MFAISNNCNPHIEFISFVDFLNTTILEAESLETTRIALGCLEEYGLKRITMTDRLFEIELRVVTNSNDNISKDQVKQVRENRVMSILDVSVTKLMGIYADSQFLNQTDTNRFASCMVHLSAYLASMSCWLYEKVSRDVNQYETYVLI